MKALLYWDDGDKMMIDVWNDHDGPVFIDKMEREVMEGFNRRTPPNGHKVIKVKLFRTGDVHTPQYILDQINPPLFKGEHARPMVADHISRDAFKPDKKGKKKRTVRIW